MNSQKTHETQDRKKRKLNIMEGEEEKVQERDSRRVRFFLGNSFRITKRVELGFHTQPSLTGERGREGSQGGEPTMKGGIRETCTAFFSYRGI